MKSGVLKPPYKLPGRAALFLAGALLIALVYIFQRTSVAELLPTTLHPNVVFIINRTTRLILNDLACFFIIVAVFHERKYLTVALWLFWIELLVILPIYFVVKLSIEGNSELSSPLLSQIHRLIVNPVLMILLMAGFVFQRFATK